MRVQVLACAFLLAFGGVARAEEAPEKPPRPPLPPAPPSAPVAWQRQADVGIDLALVARPATRDAGGVLTGVRLRPTVGFGVHGGWDFFRYLHFTAYFVDARHDVLLPPGALAQPSVSSDSVSTYSLGARLSPTWPISERARAWITGGFGWGRLEYPRMQASDGSGMFTVRERSDSFAEVPIGVGASFEIIRRWLSVQVEATGAFVAGQAGSASRDAQAIDSFGKKRNIGGLPLVDGNFVQTVGFTLEL